MNKNKKNEEKSIKMKTKSRNLKYSRGKSLSEYRVALLESQQNLRNLIRIFRISWKSCRNLLEISLKSYRNLFRILWISSESSESHKKLRNFTRILTNSTEYSESHQTLRYAWNLIGIFGIPRKRFFGISSEFSESWNLNGIFRIS